MSVWLITGAARGLGAAIVEAVLAAGHQVVAGARNPLDVLERFGERDDLLAVGLDVTNEGQVERAVRSGVERFERIDVAVNNAGYGVLGAVEEVSDAEAMAMFEVNVFGVHRVIRSVLPVMREQRSGLIMNIGSGGGFAASAAHGLYGATKFAVEAITEALDIEIRPLGLRAIVIEPGAFRTDFFSDASIRSAAVQLEAYRTADGGDRREAFRTVDGLQPGDPAKAGAALLHLADLDDPPLRVQLGRDSLARVEAKLEFVGRELDRWRELAESTDFDDAGQGFVDPGRVAAAGSTH